MPEIFLQMKLTNLIESHFILPLVVLFAIVRRVLIDGRLGIGFGIVYDLVKERMGVKFEDCDVRVLEAEVACEGGETDVPVGDGALRDRMAPFAREGHAVERGDVEDKEVAGAGYIELLYSYQLVVSEL